MWGLLFNGRLEYWVLPEEVDEKGKSKSANMTGARYNYFVRTFLAKWMLPEIHEGREGSSRRGLRKISPLGQDEGAR
jgi:hypothetical protein